MWAISGKTVRFTRTRQHTGTSSWMVDRLSKTVDLLGPENRRLTYGRKKTTLRVKRLQEDCPMQQDQKTDWYTLLDGGWIISARLFNVEGPENRCLAYRHRLRNDGSSSERPADLPGPVYFSTPAKKTNKKNTRPIGRWIIS